MAGWGDQIKGKKQSFTAFFLFYLDAFYHFILLFQARVSQGPTFPPIQKPGHHFP